MVITSWNFWLFWMLAFLGFPIGGLAASFIVGPVTIASRASLAGAITGVVLGWSQWFVLSGPMPLPTEWIIATSIGMGIGLGISVGFLGSEMNDNKLLWRAAITGLSIGIGQWLILRQIVPQSEIWIAAITLAWVLGWFITRRIGVDLNPKWSVFGAAGALSFQVVTGVALYFLLQ